MSEPEDEIREAFVARESEISMDPGEEYEEYEARVEVWHTVVKNAMITDMV